MGFVLACFIIIALYYQKKEGSAIRRFYLYALEAKYLFKINDIDVLYKRRIEKAAVAFKATAVYVCLSYIWGREIMLSA